MACRFALLVDTGGVAVKDVSVFVNNGVGIAVAKRGGGAWYFHYSGNPKLLRVQWLDPKEEAANATYLTLSAPSPLRAPAASTIPRA